MRHSNDTQVKFVLRGDKALNSTSTISRLTLGASTKNFTKQVFKDLKTEKIDTSFDQIHSPRADSIECEIKNRGFKGAAAKNLRNLQTMLKKTYQHRKNLTLDFGNAP